MRERGDLARRLESRPGSVLRASPSDSALINAEHRPTITARRDQPFPVVSLRYFEGERHFDLVL